jgi:hypothetical protein
LVPRITEGTQLWLKTIAATAAGRPRMSATTLTTIVVVELGTVIVVAVI